ncbi:hypothetical protein FGADI_10705 [Fusarium gaditjirri]|uniref:Heterokaryon incompatibility domain-containing protein n=1 Tax=Fusarium gaditjirri TaxID=282569 RepID=A0A8H4WRD1_9HYPO|nr:hypothetical protein FGADI_10705 [Fusarium gaditjirri]
MERIYGNAYVVVAAASSRNCEQGFIQRTDRILFPFNTNSNVTHAFGIYSPLYKAKRVEDLVFSPWLERGWTFQERIASTRILMFTERNIHFKCQSFSESMGTAKDTFEDDYIMLDRKTIDSGNTAAMYHEWDKKVAQVNLGYHQFTRKTDVLPSIAGIAALFSKKLRDEYAAGLWKNSMHQSLCWGLLSRATTSYEGLLKSLHTPSPCIAPSWSWASQSQWISFNIYGSPPLADYRPEFDSLETNITLRGESVFGEVRDAALDITSKLFVGTQRITYYRTLPQLDLPQESVRFDGRYFAEIKPDFSVEDIFESHGTHTLAAPISFLVIGSATQRHVDADLFPSTHPSNSETLGCDTDAGPDYESSSSPSMSAESGDGLEKETRLGRAAYGLLIHPAGNPNEYYRVGTFVSTPYMAGGLSLFDNVEVRTVRLV